MLETSDCFIGLLVGVATPTLSRDSVAVAFSSKIIVQ